MDFNLYVQSLGFLKCLLLCLCLQKERFFVAQVFIVMIHKRFFTALKF